MARWLWPTVLTRWVEEVQKKLNRAPAREDAQKLLPSGKGVTLRRIYLFPKDYDAADKLILGDREVIQEPGSPPLSSRSARQMFSETLPGVNEVLAGVGPSACLLSVPEIVGLT